MISQVFIESEATAENLEKKTETLMENCGWRTLIKSDDTVVLKPNIGACKPERIQASNTDPKLVAAVCSVIKSRANRVIIGESDLISYPMEEATKLTGIYEVARECGVEVMNFSKDNQVPIESEILNKWALPRTIVDADAFITLPKLKTHGLTIFTGSLKNQWGCLPNRRRVLFHDKLNIRIAELNRIIKPKLSIMDGIIAMEEQGPVNGKPVNLNVILGSRDIVALDATACRLINVDPFSVGHICSAADMGLGNIKESDIAVIGGINFPLRVFELPYDDLVNSVLKFIYAYPWLTQILIVSPLFVPLKYAGLLTRYIQTGFRNRSMEKR